MAYTGVDGLSFGVELEFNFWFKISSRDGNDSDDIDESILSPEEDESLPPALTTPYDHIMGQYNWAQGLLEEAIMSVEGSTIKNDYTPENTPLAELNPLAKRILVFPSDGWTVKEDVSVSDSDIRAPRGYGYLAYEITSPALWDLPESLHHVWSVVHAIQSRFRLRVNTRTGFHVHVGSGAKLSGSLEPGFEYESQHHSVEVLKRATSLMWAADGFLCHAHPPERGINTYAPSIRHASNLAYGLVPESDDFDQRLPSREIAIPAIDPTPERAADAGHGGIRRLYPELFPALRPDNLDDEALKRFEVMNSIFTPECDRLAIRTVNDGVAQIMHCADEAEVAMLLSPAPISIGRLNYNLRNCIDSYLTGTVEFREATGSMDATWVAYWANICLGIFRFARNASDGRFWAVISALSEAEAAAMAGNPHHYDMISLLFDLGLFAEALFLHRNLHEDAVGFWYPCRLPEKRPFEPFEVNWDLADANVEADDGEGGWGSGSQSSPLWTELVPWVDVPTEGAEWSTWGEEMPADSWEWTGEADGDAAGGGEVKKGEEDEDENGEGSARRDDDDRSDDETSRGETYEESKEGINDDTNDHKAKEELTGSERGNSEERGWGDWFLDLLTLGGLALARAMLAGRTA